MGWNYGYLPYITLPTRITDFSATCIDHIFIRDTSKYRERHTEIFSGILYCDITDHLPCFVTLTCSNLGEDERPIVRLYGEKNTLKFKDLMTNESWDDLYTEDTDWYNNFIDLVYNTFQQSFPLVKLSRKRAKDKPWITKGLKISTKEKHRLYRLSLRNCDPRVKMKYKSYKNLLRTCIRKSESFYYQELFENTKSSAYNLWKQLGPIINNKKKKRGNLINKIIKDGVTFSDAKGIANALNSYFCEIGQELQSKFPNTDQSFTNYLPTNTTENFFLQPITAHEIKLEILKLNPKKSPGDDNIGARLLQLCSDVFSENLAKIYNNSITKGEYPKQLKIAKVIALFKKGEKYYPKNYRPISLLSIFNKILEKLLCKQLVSFIERNKILYNYQFGFRKLYSTTMALIEFSDNIHRLLDEGNYVIGIFIDFTKAFDTVDHEILLHKLYRYGIRGHANNFFRSYLTNRTQYTYVNGEKSDISRITCGVPQGSVLGPLFFVLYINDLYRSVDNVITRLFADDTSLVMYDNDFNRLVNHVSLTFQKLSRWCIENKLTISMEKTNFVSFHTPNKPLVGNVREIATENMVINRVDAVKYLGITIDEKLTWNAHVEYVCNSLIKFFGIFKQLRHKVTTNIVRQLYHAFIYSKIKYGLEVYGNTSSRNISKLQVMQNKLLKYVMRFDIRTGTNLLHTTLDIMKVEDIHKNNVLTFVNMCLMGKCPEIFNQYYRVKTTPYETRQEGSLDMPSHRIEYGARSVKVVGVKLWNRYMGD